MIEALAYWLAGLAWAALLYRAPALVHSWRVATRRALWMTLLAVTLAVTVRLPAVRALLDQLVGVPNLAQLFENGFILVAIWGVQDFLVHLHLHRPPGASDAPAPVAGLCIHTWLLGAAVATMAVLFVLAPVHAPTVDFWVRYSDEPMMLAYRLTYLAYLGAGLVTVVRLCPRYGRLTARPTVALGLRLSAVGGAIGLVYVGHEAGYALLRGMGGTYPLEGIVDPGRLRELLITAALVPLLVGSTIPAWGERVGLASALAAVGRWTSGYHAYRQLYPLWRDLVRLTPEIALQGPPAHPLDIFAWRNLWLQLYRCVIEIWDGRLALRPYLEPGIADAARRACRAAGVAPQEELFVVEASALAAGMRAKAHGRQAAEPTVLPLDGRLGGTVLAGASLDHDVALLSHVARCYRSSPVVREVVAGTERTALAVSGHGEVPLDRLEVRRP